MVSLICIRGNPPGATKEIAEDQSGSRASLQLFPMDHVC